MLDVSQLSEESVLNALRDVHDSHRESDVVSSGMITGLVIKNGNVFFAIEVPSDVGADKEPLRQACEQAVMAIPEALSVTAVLTAHKQSPGLPSSKDQKRTLKGENIPNIKAIVAVASAKGGVGKSTTAVNLALALSKLDLTIGLLDADVYGPSIPRMMGIDQKPTSNEKKMIEPLTGFGIVTMSIGYLVPNDTPMIWRGPMVQSAIEQLLRDVNWGPLDVLVIDLPPGTGDAQLTLCQRVPLTGAIIVSTPQDVALSDVRKGMNMFSKVNVPVLGIVENMSFYLCPSCGTRSEIFGHGGARTLADEFKAQFLGEIPLHLSIRETSDSGQPIVATQPDSIEAGAYCSIATNLCRQIDAAVEATTKSTPRIIVE